MASHDYGRASTDEAHESQPLLDDQHDGAASTDRPSRSWSQRILAGLTAATAPLAEPEKLGPTEKLLLAFALILLLIAAVFIGLFAGAQNRLSHGGGHGRAPGGKPGNGDVACTTSDCVLASASILKSIDSSVSPCDDFYQFAAGGWLADLDHQIPDDAGLFGSGQLVAARNSQIVRSLLADAPKFEDLAATGDDDVDRHNLAKLRTFYDSCLDTATLDKAGSTPLLDLLAQIKERFDAKSQASLDHSEPQFTVQDHRKGPLPPPPGTPRPLPPNTAPGRAPQPHPPVGEPGPPPPRSRRQSALTSTLAWAHSRGIGALWEVYVDGDPIKDPTEGTVYLAPSGLGFPDKAYYDDQDELDFYYDVVTDALQTVERAAHKHDDGEDEHEDSHSHKSKKGKKGDKKKAIVKLAHRVVAFEQAIARLTPDGDFLADPVATYNPISVNKLGYTIDTVSWPDYLSALSVKVPHKVVVQSPAFFQGLSELVSRTTDDVLEAYLAWTAIRTYGTDLGPKAELRRPAEALKRRAKGVDIDAREDRNTVCLNALNEALGFMAGRYYVQRAFPPAARSKTVRIIDSIISAFKARLPELDWLDPKTRRAAEVKADHVRIKVGWPESPNTTDPSSLQRYYGAIDVKPGDHFGNRLRSATALTQKGLAVAGRTLDALRWDMFPAEVNAYYNPPGNEIAFPAGILQAPYFDVSWPDYLQYGAFGAVAGHELSHAFDPTGRLYDERGYLRDWWTNDTSREFGKRQRCLMEQYGNYTLDDGTGKLLPLNPKLTIGEDVADGGGVAQSFRAWQTEASAASGKGVGNALLPGLEAYTREQLFFIAYAISYARNLRPQEALRRIRTDPHSPNPYRVKGVLTNFEPFYEAFGCSAGSGMWTEPEDRCKIW